MDAFDHQFQIERRTDHTVVWQYGYVRDFQAMADLTEAVDSLLEQPGAHNVLFDARETFLASEGVFDELCAWLSKRPQLKRVAVLPPGPDHLAPGDVAGQPTVRSFTQRADALAWLRGTEPS